MEHGGLRRRGAFSAARAGAMSRGNRDDMRCPADRKSAGPPRGRSKGPGRSRGLDNLRNSTLSRSSREDGKVGAARSWANWVRFAVANQLIR